MSIDRETLLSEYSDAYKAWCGCRPRGQAWERALAAPSHELQGEISRLYGWAAEEEEQRAEYLRREAEVEARAKARFLSPRFPPNPAMAEALRAAR